MKEAGESEIIKVLDGNMVIVQDPGKNADDYLRLNKSREKRYCFGCSCGKLGRFLDTFFPEVKVNAPRGPFLARKRTGRSVRQAKRCRILARFQG